MMKLPRIIEREGWAYDHNQIYLEEKFFQIVAKKSLRFELVSDFMIFLPKKEVFSKKRVFTLIQSFSSLETNDLKKNQEKGTVHIESVFVFGRDFFSNGRDKALKY